MLRRIFIIALLAMLAGCVDQMVQAAPQTAPVQRPIATAPKVSPVTLPTATPLPATPTATTVPPSPSPEPPTATPGPPPLRGGEPAPRMVGELVMVTYSLDLYRRDGGMDAATVQQLGLDGEVAIESATRMLGGELAGRVSISFEPPQSGPCAIRGITRSDLRMIRLFYAPDSDVNRVRGILAHELFHQNQRDYYGERDHRKADNILLEGMAVWGTADYFRAEDGRPLYQVRVEQALAEGRILPLDTDLEADCRTTTRNDIYNQWASFVEYLHVTYGREALDAIYRSGNGRSAGSSDWQAVYGTSLRELEADWLAWLQSNLAPTAL